MILVKIFMMNISMNYITNNKWEIIMKEFIIEFNKFLTILSKLLKSTNKIERIEGYLVLLTIFYFICIGFYLILS